ncbi:hypothetical protein HK104_009640 [Borealophlyctis nickersoniae]|nr:hypothetical protein HK104_009640 [Borealophlyctis nickersoniae]
MTSSGSRRSSHPGSEYGGDVLSDGGFLDLPDSDNLVNFPEGDEGGDLNLSSDDELVKNAGGSDEVAGGSFRPAKGYRGRSEETNGPTGGSARKQEGRSVPPAWTDDSNLFLDKNSSPGPSTPNRFRTPSRTPPKTPEFMRKASRSDAKSPRFSTHRNSRRMDDNQRLRSASNSASNSPAPSEKSFVRDAAKDAERFRFEPLAENFDDSFGASPARGGFSVDVTRRQTDEEPRAGREEAYGALGLKQREKMMDDLKKENFELKMKVYFLQERLQKCTPDGFAQVMAENDEFKALVQSLQIELDQFRSGYEDAVSNLEEQIERSEELAAKIERIETQNQSLKARVNELQALLEAAGDVDAIKAENRAHLAEVERLRLERDEQATELAEAEDTAARVKKETAASLKIAQDQRDAALERIGVLEEELVEAKSGLDASEVTVVALKRELQEFASRVEALCLERDAALEETLQVRQSQSKQLKNLLDLNENLQQKAQDYKDQLDAACRERDAAIDETRSLQRQIEIQQSSGDAQLQMQSKELSELQTLNGKLKRANRQQEDDLKKALQSRDAALKDAEDLRAAVKEAEAKRSSESAEIRNLRKKLRDSELALNASKREAEKAKRSEEDEKTLRERVRSEVEKELRGRLEREIKTKIEKEWKSKVEKAKKDEASKAVASLADIKDQLEQQAAASVADLKDQLEKQAELVSAKTLELEKIQQELSALNSHADGTENDANRDSARAPSALWQELSELRSRIDAGNAENQRLRKEIESLQLVAQNTGEFEQKLAQCEQENEELRGELSARVAETERYAGDIKKLKEQLKAQASAAPSIDAAEVFKERRAAQEREEMLKERLAEAVRENKSLQDRLDDECRACDRLRASLEESAEAVENFEASERKVRTQLDALKNEVDSKGREIEVLREEVRHRTSDVENKTREIEVLRASLEESTEAVGSIEAGERKVRAQLDALKKQVDSKERQVAVLQEEVRNRTSDVRNQAREIEVLRESLEESTEAVGSIEAGERKVRAQLETLKKEVESKGREIEALREEVRDKTSDLETKGREIEVLRKDSEHKTKEIELKCKEVELKTKEMEGVQRELESKIQEIDGRREALENITKERDALVEEAKKESKAVHAALASKERDIEDLRRALKEAGRALDQASAYEKAETETRIEEACAPLREQISELTAKLAEQAADMEQLLKEGDETGAAHQQTLQQMNERLSKETAKYKNVILDLRNQVSHAATEVIRLTAQIDDINRAYHEDEAKYQEAIDHIENELEQKTKESADTRRQFDEALGRLHAAEDNLQQKEEQLDNLAEEVNKLSRELAQTEDRSEDTEARLSARLSDLETVLASRDEHIQVLTTQLESTRNQLKSARNDLRAATATAEETAHTDAVLIEQLEQQLDFCKQQIADFRRVNEITAEEMAFLRRELQTQTRKASEFDDRLRQEVAEKRDVSQREQDSINRRAEAVRDEVERKWRERVEEVEARRKNDVEKLEQNLARAQSQIESMSSSLQEKSIQIARLQQQVEMKSAHLEEANQREVRERENSKAELEKAREELQHSRAEFRQMWQELGEKSGQVAELSQKLENMQHQDRKVVDQLNAAEAAKASLDEKARQLQEELQQANGTVRSLESHVEKLQQNITQRDEESKDFRKACLKQIRERDALLKDRDALLVGVAQYLHIILTKSGLLIDGAKPSDIVGSNGTFSHLKEHILSRLKGLKNIKEHFDAKIERMENEFGQQNRNWESKFAEKAANLARCEEIGRIALRLKEQLGRNLAKAAQIQQRLVASEQARRELQEKYAEFQHRLGEVAEGARATELRKVLEQRIVDLETMLRDADKQGALERDGAEKRVNELLAEKRILEKQVESSNKRIQQLEEWRKLNGAGTRSLSPDRAAKIIRDNEQLRKDLEYTSSLVENLQVELRTKTKQLNDAKKGREVTLINTLTKYEAFNTTKQVKSSNVTEEVNKLPPHPSRSKPPKPHVTGGMVGSSRRRSRSMDKQPSAAETRYAPEETTLRGHRRLSSTPVFEMTTGRPERDGTGVVGAFGGNKRQGAGGQTRWKDLGE